MQCVNFAVWWYTEASQVRSCFERKEKNDTESFCSAGYLLHSMENSKTQPAIDHRPGNFTIRPYDVSFCFLSQVDEIKPK